MFNGKLVKRNGKLSFVDDKSKLGYQIFFDKLAEGQKVEFTITAGQKGPQAENIVAV